MEFDVAVLGGGPAGYTAAIRAAQLGARVVCIEKEPELGGTCLRVGCIPTKAWVQTAHALHAAREIDPKLGVVTGEPTLDFDQANEWKNAVVKQMTSGVASLFKANGSPGSRGPAASRTRARSCSKARRRAHASRARSSPPARIPIRPPIRGTRLAALRRLDRPARADGGPEAARRPRWRDHRLRVRVDLRALRHRGHDRRDARLAHPARGRGRDERAPKGVREARDRRPPRQAVHAGQRHRDRRSSSTSARARASSATSCSSRSAARRSSRGIGLEAGRRRHSIRARESRPTATGARLSRTSTRPATSPATGSSRTRPSARARSRPRTRLGHEVEIGEPAVPRPIYTDPEIAGVGLTEAAGARAPRRHRRGRPVPVGRQRAGSDVGRDDRLGQVDPRDDVRRAARRRDGRAARHRPHRSCRRRSRRGGDGRDGRGRDGAPPDAVRGYQGGRPRRSRACDPPAAAAKGDIGLRVALVG